MYDTHLLPTPSMNLSIFIPTFIFWASVLEVCASHTNLPLSYIPSTLLLPSLCLRSQVLGRIICTYCCLLIFPSSCSNDFSVAAKCNGHYPLGSLCGVCFTGSLPPSRESFFLGFQDTVPTGLSLLLFHFSFPSLIPQTLLLPRVLSPAAFPSAHLYPHPGSPPPWPWSSPHLQL